jgi:hypothetical protein
MQHCTCSVFLSGDQYHKVFKSDVTVAEIAMLRAIHGEDAVVDIRPTAMGKEKHAEELDRLRAIYGSSNVTKEGKRLLDEVFPGRAPQLPISLADIGIEYGVAEGEGVALQPKAKAGAKVRAGSAESPAAPPKPSAASALLDDPDLE